jgi:hypothetical protein
LVKQKQNTMSKTKELAGAKVIESLVYTSSQGRHYRRIYELKGRKFKIHIERDSYENQSSATGYILNTEAGKTKWEVLYSIPPSQMATIAKLPNIYGAYSENTFLADANKIAVMMTEIAF